MSVQSTKAVVLDHLVDGEVSTKNFRLESKPVPEIQDGQVLVQVVAFSHEPAQRQWIDANTDERRLYTTLIKPGETIRAPIVGRVLASKLPKYPVGTTLAGFHGWAEYAVLSEGEIFAAVPPTADGKVDLHALDVFGLAGNTAYVATAEYGKIKPGSTIVVSGAAGAIGSLVVQLAKKVFGAARVIGIAGGKAKCEWVKTLGADECIDYKSSDWEEKLRAAVPDYADIYFDNVGGPMLDVMLQLVKPNGTIVVIGAISTYNGEPLKISNWPQVIYNRLNIRGFVNLDHPELIAQGQTDFAKWIGEGKIDVDEIQTVVHEKIEDVPKTWLRLFDGSAKGKIISQIAA
ncbi:Putative NADP-dependent oxidoreductase YfmJ [Vanrija pseudolonga]|uniref:NADP-dependent oxidoreductase YfmJ n=1 Tax=Vanrija pseudolonga TaxID=143232 RepID=A0AAF0YKX5_9TREE|nr:Putative NADP-dependent oxidoreductase YfmJ [Vanrija pseudolonga]